MKCQDCGKEGDDVREDTCPYVEEICGRIEYIVICSECYHQRCMDI